MEMTGSQTHIIKLKKLKKDGSIDREIMKTVADRIVEGGCVILPVDFINGVCCIDGGRRCDSLLNQWNDHLQSVSRLISSFKMLEDCAVIDKLEFDFLHRIWPGEMSVFLKDKGCSGHRIPMRMPKGRLSQELIDLAGKPLLFFPLMKSTSHLVYQKLSILNGFRDQVDMILIIEEFCKDHTLPTVLDISDGDLKILNEGRISSEEIKSLYFLGKDDSAL